MYVMNHFHKAYRYVLTKYFWKSPGKYLLYIKLRFFWYLEWKLDNSSSHSESMKTLKVHISTDLKQKYQKSRIFRALKSFYG